ncbi:MAG: MFS transporter [Bacteroidetes bacterium QS_8_68_15]|nr:MAG: MFS transporter [Bacteroidetes bacterium QS_8_68_15]
MADAMGNSFLIIVLPLYIASAAVDAEALGLSESLATGLVLALFGLVSSPAQPLAGRLSDRAGKRKAFVLGGLVVLAAANAAFLLVDSYLGMFALRAVQGLAAALTITAGIALVNELSAGLSRGQNMGIYNSFRLAGFGAGPLVAGVILEAGPYRLPGALLEGAAVSGFQATFVVAALLALVSAGLVAWLVRDPAETTPTTRRLALRFRAPAGANRLLDAVFTLGLATFVMSSCISMLSSIEPAVNARLGQGPVLFAVQFATFIGALAAAQPFIGKVSDRLGRKTFIVWGLVALAPTTLAQGLVAAPGQMIAARFCQGLAGAAVFAPALALAGDLAAEGQSGAQLSVLTMAFGLGIASGQILSGFFVRYGFAVPFALGAVLALAAAALVQTQVVEAAPTEAPEAAVTDEPVEAW